MDKQFSHLMSPGYIGNVEIKNRIWASPLMTEFGGPDGGVTPRLIDFYEEKAKGGAGFINVEAAFIDQVVSRAGPHQLGLYDNALQTGMADLVTAMQDWGAKCSIQICHMGLQLIMCDKLWSASPSDGDDDIGGGFRVPFRELTKDEIVQLIQDFTMAASRVKNSGFDMVQVHAAHGHLLSMFLSPFYNKRTDEYGGSVEKRARIVIEILENIKAVCGKDYPVTVRMSALDYHNPDPITIEDSIKTAKMLEEAGAAAIDVSGGGNTSIPWMIPAMYIEQGTHVAAADAIKNKSGIKIPVIVSGGITTPAFAEEILSQGKADFIGLGRVNLADPWWGKKIEDGVPEDIVPCIRCSMCLGTMEQYLVGKGLTCSVNPRLGFEGRRNVAPLKKKRKVAIVGGGPGGMEAARLATLRGHDVTLYEKRKLGGALHEASFDPSLKPDIKFLLDYYKGQMKKLKVNIIEKEATVNTIVNENYDIAIVATGAQGKKPQILGSDKAHVYTDLQVTGGKGKELGGTIIVVGGGVIAAEIAVSEAMKGNDVILTTRRAFEEQIADENAVNSKRTLLKLLNEYNVQLNLGLKLKEITDDGIICIDEEGNSHQFKGDSVVMCAGFLPDNTLAKALIGKVKEVRSIGDCVKPRLIGDAIREGWLAANQI